MTRVLVTGASGYIGSHTCVELLTNGFDVVGIDNLSNSSPVAIDRVRELSRESGVPGGRSERPGRAVGGVRLAPGGCGSPLRRLQVRERLDA